MSKTAKCLKCGSAIADLGTATPIKHPTGTRYYCPNCIRNLIARSQNSCTYSQENTVFVSAPTMQGYTISKEMEVSNAARNILSYREWNTLLATCDSKRWSITADCTVAVEIKTCVYNGLNSYNKDSKTFDKIAKVSEWSNATDYGTHTNIGHTDFNGDKMSILRQWRESLLTPLQTTMLEHPSWTKAIFGRTIGGWCGRMGSDPMEHAVFINLQHSNWVEFRINKYVSCEQDAYSTKVCIALFDDMLNFCKAIEANRRTYSGQPLRDANRKTASKYASKLVKTFETAYAKLAETATVTA